MFSIDQNCHPLWDTLPKLQALAAHGRRVTHFIEDIDVAFTSLGAGVGDRGMALERERFHRSGGADWGAALFYSEFLGRLPVDVRDWEPLAGMKTSTLARKLGRTVDDLFHEFSPSDNWQLIGSSYVEDQQHHRVIGDLTVSETAPFLRQIMAKARADMTRTFPEAAAQQRIGDWFAAEEKRLDDLLRNRANGRLVDLYRGWMQSHLPPEVALEATSSLFAVGNGRARTALLELFLKDYARAAALYNEAVSGGSEKLHGLDLDAGELPFFAVLDYHSHRVRTSAFLREDALHVGEQSFPLGPDRTLPVAALTGAGIGCLAGKAVLLVVQARLGDEGAALALPYRGSLYMPAVSRFVDALAAANLLPAKLHPVTRVRFHLLDRLRELDTIIHLPAHLVDTFGREELPAREIGAQWAQLAAEAKDRLALFRRDDLRRHWQQTNFPDLEVMRRELNQERRALAEKRAPHAQMKKLWEREREVQIQLLERTVAQIARDTQLADLDYWDSRGALWPWSVALGGQTFYDSLIQQAEIYDEPVPAGWRYES